MTRQRVLTKSGYASYPDLGQFLIDQATRYGWTAISQPVRHDHDGSLIRIQVARPAYAGKPWIEYHLVWRNTGGAQFKLSTINYRTTYTMGKWVQSYEGVDKVVAKIQELPHV